MVTRARLDAELVRRGLVRSRGDAATAIAEGRVRVAGSVATKAATAVAPDTPLLVDDGADGPDPGWASRGAHKLLGALEAFGVDVRGRRALDAGASTGGFTDVLLRAGVASVQAVDVGRGLLHWRLQTDDRVTVVDQTNVRSLTPEMIGGPVDLVVGDLSFIPLHLVLPALAACCLPGADLLLLVKPQFEVGRERLGTGGVVRDPVLRASSVRDVAAFAQSIGLGTAGVVASSLPGPAGNVEYVLWLRDDAPPLVEADLLRAVAEGPS